MVKVLVGKRQRPSFPGFWAEFEGEEISPYEDTTAEYELVVYRTTSRAKTGEPREPERPNRSMFT